ncbi:MAG: nitroreductase family protein [Candidatus Theseobacter exili]|nr:nitroreductase family protein [Candidatus Theseobacter exili]
MDAIKAITTRHSVRLYSGKPVEKDIIQDLVLAGSLAPTARNIQPWLFVALTEQDLVKEIANITDHGKFMANAPASILVFSEDTKYYLEDGCAATENILVAANAYGLGTCWIAGDKKPYCDQIKILLNVPERYKLISIISLGYPKGNIKTASKKLLDNVLCWNKYSQ